MGHIFAGEDPRSLARLLARVGELDRNTNRPVAVEALILDDRDRLLLGRRGPACRDGVGLLEGVGGRCEGEDLRAELARELREEIGGCTVKIRAFLEVKSDTPVLPDGRSGKSWIIASYLCRIAEGTPVPREPEKCLGFEWVGLDVRPPDLSSSARQAWDLLHDLFGPL